MKNLFFIFSLLPRLLWSQYHFDFETGTLGTAGSFMNNRVEQIPAGRWECLEEGAISGSYSLRHHFDNPEPGVDHFVIRLDPITDPGFFTCSFRVRHSYPPSSANNWQVAFLADYEREKELGGEAGGTGCRITGGWILGVNFTGSDDQVRLWECREGDCLERCVTTLNYQEQVGTDAAPSFRLEWSNEGWLEIFFTGDPDSVPMELIGTCQLENLPTGRYLVARYEYSAAQDRKLWLDDIHLEGNFVRDTIPPVITGVELLDETHLRVGISEQVSLSQGYSFELQGVTGWDMIPDTVYHEGGKIILGFPRIIPNREELQLGVTGICDGDANCLSDTMVSCLRNDPEWGDLVFNELMVDPSPGVLLPEEEFVEIFNRSGYALDIFGWWVEVEDRSHFIPGMTLEPLTFGVVSGITLPNGGGSLALFSDKGTLVHAVTYAVPWNGLDWKKEGGWSLESPDPDLVCTVSGMWEFSLDPKGGTPGRVNSNRSVRQDLEPPLFLYAGFGEQPGSLSLQFSEPIGFSDEELDKFTLMPGGEKPVEASKGFPPAERLILQFGKELQEGPKFTLRIPALPDCSGNLSRPIEFRGGGISGIRSGCLLINEIMYDPEEGAPEFIELFHPGNDFFDLRDLALGAAPGGSQPFSPVALSDHSRIFAPGEYLVLTENAAHLMDAYHLEPSGCWVEVTGLTAMNNSGGTIYLTDRGGVVVDVALYGDQMHMELLEFTRGISLERISAVRPGSVPENWHSAASIEGYSTPGRANSQSVTGTEGNRLLQAEPEVFSPDNDGYQDLVEIEVSPGTQGWVLTLWITDLEGRPVRYLANNDLTGPAVTYTWDGEGDDGTMAGAGFYVIHARGYLPLTGERWVKRVALGLVYR